MKRIVIVGLIAILIALTFLLVHQVLRHEIVKYPEIFFDGFIPPIKGTPVSSTAEKVTILISSQTYPLSSASNQAIAFISVNSVCEKSLEANLVRISIAAIVDAKTASEAVRKAYDKALVIAKALNATLGAVLEVTEKSYLTYIPIRGAVFKAAEKVSTEIYETKATISASVTLKVELVQG